MAPYIPSQHHGGAGPPHTTAGTEGATLPVHTHSNTEDAPYEG